jgi:signal transduction histidine kinase
VARESVPVSASAFGPVARIRRWFTRSAMHASIKPLLVVGFSLVLGFWLLAGVDVLRQFQAVDQQVRTMTERFIQIEEDVSTIRAGVFLGGLDVRDAMLDTSLDRTEGYRAQLQQYRTSCLDALGHISRQAAAANWEREFDLLQQEVTGYWAALLPLLALPPPQRATEARRILVEQVIPRREPIIRIAQQLRTLNRSRFQGQQRDAARLYATARNRIWIVGAIALLATAAVSLAVLAYAGVLERRLRDQLQRDALTTAELQRLSAQLVRAQEDERRLIARELHDEVGQALTALKIQLALAKPPADGPRPRALEDARHIADGALQSVRHLSRLLHPPMLDDMGLPAALRWYLASFSDRTGVAAELVEAGMSERPAAEIEICLYRIVQEATTNVARHASARQCRIYLQRLPASILLGIEDDGIGFDARQTASKTQTGLGLLGIRERVAGFRGTFRIESSVGGGTRLHIELPALASGAASASTETHGEGRS